jgi:transposase
MTLYGPAAVERAMKIQEVILRAMSGELKWHEAAEILDMRPRSLRRWRQRYEEHGYDGLFDRRTSRPSPRRAPYREVEKILQLYREKYYGFNVYHYHRKLKQEHGVTLSYSFVKKALQEAGLVSKKRKRGRHFKKRERRSCFGEMLHIDGSPHAWLSLKPDEKQCLIPVLDDATSRLLYAQLWPKETAWAILSALGEVIQTEGIPMVLYTDRAGWAFHTPKAGGKVDKKKLTQVGRVLKQLGVEHIPAYTPQARGRSERINRTLQDRLVNELRVKGIRTIHSANRYLREQFIPQYNEEFSREPADPESAFVSPGQADLDQIICFMEERTVAKDNTVVMKKVKMQIEKQPGRATCAGLRVNIRKHLNEYYSVWWGTRLLGRYDRKGRQIPSANRDRRNSTSGYALGSVAAKTTTFAEMADT